MSQNNNNNGKKKKNGRGKKKAAPKVVAPVPAPVPGDSVVSTPVPAPQQALHHAPPLPDLNRFSNNNNNSGVRNSFSTPGGSFPPNMNMNHPSMDNGGFMYGVHPQMSNMLSQFSMGIGNMMNDFRNNMDNKFNNMDKNMENLRKEMDGFYASGKEEKEPSADLELEYAERRRNRRLSALGKRRVPEVADVPALDPPAAPAAKKARPEVCAHS